MSECRQIQEDSKIFIIGLILSYPLFSTFKNNLNIAFANIFLARRPELAKDAGLPRTEGGAPARRSAPLASHRIIVTESLPILFLKSFDAKYFLGYGGIW